MLIPQYQVLVLKLSPIYTVSLNTVFSIPQNQCYPGTPCTLIRPDIEKSMPERRFQDQVSIADHRTANALSTPIAIWKKGN